MKEELQKKLDEKLRQLGNAERENIALSSGKYKDLSKAKMAKTLITSLEKEINELTNKIESL